MWDVEQIQQSDGRARAMGHAMAEAFREEPNFTYMLPNSDTRERRLSWFFGSFVARLGLRYGEVYAPSAGGGGAVWIRPGSGVSPWGALRAGLAVIPFRIGLHGARRAATLGGRIDALREEVAPPLHWYLMALGVRPSDQRKGLGRELVRPVLDRADRDGIPCYLETFRERTAGYYRRLGFEVVRLDALPGGPPFWCMTRSPQP